MQAPFFPREIRRVCLLPSFPPFLFLEYLRPAIYRRLATDNWLIIRKRDLMWQKEEQILISSLHVEQEKEKNR